MLEEVLVMNFVMKCAMWAVVVFHTCLNDIRSITSQYSMSVRLLLAPYRSNQRLEILYAIDWEMLEWNGTPQMDTFGST